MRLIDADALIEQGMTLEEKIKETRFQIGNTKSKQRKYELHRHLNKLLKQQRRENNGKANRI